MLKRLLNRRASPLLDLLSNFPSLPEFTSASFTPTSFPFSLSFFSFLSLLLLSFLSFSFGAAWRGEAKASTKGEFSPEESFSLLRLSLRTRLLEELCLEGLSELEALLPSRLSVRSIISTLSVSELPGCQMEARSMDRR